MSRGNKGVHFGVPGKQSYCRRCPLLGNKEAEVFGHAPKEGCRIGRDRGLKAYSEEDHFLLGLFFRKGYGIVDAVDHPHVRTFGFCVQQAACGARDPHHVPESYHACPAFCQGDCNVNICFGGDADRAARAADYFYFFRKHAP